MRFESTITKEIKDKMRMKNIKKLEQLKSEQGAKAPKTVKVSTLVRIALIIVALIVTFIAGGVVTKQQSDQYQAKVQAEAKALVNYLKSKR